MSNSEVKIHLAFRFHGNFYHSYRGDTPDELGFGKDIRIIRRIIEVFDEFNANGIDARATWDIENYFSFEKIMPEHCPDIIESLGRRVTDGKDEMQVMSYNNGLVSAHTAEEFDAAIGRAVTNAAGSGLKDLFPNFETIVRPQEMMYTPINLKMYPAHGIDGISLFYSAVPFNAFSNFIPQLSLEQRFNPLTLTYPGIDETMTLVPAHNHGDVADNISLRWWLKRLRRKQLSSAEPKDLLLLIDADADDEYWYGFNWPVVSTLLAAARGIKGLIESVRDLDFLEFTTPGRYLKSHTPVGSITIRQDTADGGFDGFSSWAEKWSNHQLWTGIERSRVLELQSRHLLESADAQQARDEAEKLLAESFEARLKAMSTTHFGLSSPVMNLTRLRAGAALVQASVESASRAFRLAVEAAAAEQEVEGIEFSLFDYVRGLSTDVIEYRPKPSKALVRIPLSISDADAGQIALFDKAGNRLPHAIRRAGSDSLEGDVELSFVESMGAGESQDYHIELSGKQDPAPLERPASIEGEVLENEFLKIRFDKNMQPVNFQFSGSEFAEDVFMQSAVVYNNRTTDAPQWETTETGTLGDGLISLVRVRAELPFQADGEKRVEIEREYMLVSGLPYLYATTRVAYPKTRSENFKKARAKQLEQEYDGNWQQVIPCEIRPAILGQKGRPLRVWKHNYIDHVSYYDLNYGEFSKNAELDSFNNHITHAWVAVTDREKGLLVAQTADVSSCFAFCPMRTRTTQEGTRIFLNPFGAYYGKQLKYVTAFSGLGKLIGELMAESLDSFAVSYNGRAETFSLMIAPYMGDGPPEETRCDAEAFAYPYAVVSRSEKVKTPGHRTWSSPIELHPK
jgi:hypothetical protein